MAADINPNIRKICTYCNDRSMRKLSKLEQNVMVTCVACEVAACNSCATYSFLVVDSRPHCPGCFQVLMEKELTLPGAMVSFNLLVNRSSKAITCPYCAWLIWTSSDKQKCNHICAQVNYLSTELGYQVTIYRDPKPVMFDQTFQQELVLSMRVAHRLGAE